MADLRIEKLDARDVGAARALFDLLADSFGEPQGAVSDAYIERILGSTSFWALAAFDGEDVIGGLTAHEIAMTKSESREMFVYDIAVRSDHQRRGVGRALMKTVIELAPMSGIKNIFVFADNHDLHALAFYHALGGGPSLVTCFDFLTNGISERKSSD